MSKICGYSCEHNKSGVCQISGCDKKSIISEKTETQTFTRYIDPVITELQQENKQLKEELKNKPDTEITLQDDKGNKFMLIQTERINMQEELNKTIERLFNNWNKLKEYIVKEQTRIVIENTDEDEFIYTDLLNKMQELEGSDNNGQ